MTAKWTMKDGSTILICDMSDEHLDNAIEMLERKYDEKIKAISATSFAVDISDGPDIYLPEIEEIFPIISYLFEEKAVRKINETH